MDDRVDQRGESLRDGNIFQPRSKASELNLMALDCNEAQPIKKKRNLICWNDLKNLKLVGQGAHCTVHSADLDGKAVAVKMLKLENRDDPIALHDLECEVDLMGKINHPNILSLYGTGTSEGCRFLVIERIAATLHNHLTKSGGIEYFAQRAVAKAWPMKRVLACGEELAGAVAYLHDEAFEAHSCLHRDLKPDNVGLTKEGK